MRDHLFEALERLKTNEIDVEQAKAMASIGTVLVNSAKVELLAMRLSGSTVAPSDFIQLGTSGQPQGALPAKATAPTIGSHAQVPEEPLEVRYGRYGNEYYARVLTRDRDGDLHVRLVEVGRKGLKGQIGAAVDQVREYANMEALEAEMLKAPVQ